MDSNKPILSNPILWLFISLTLGLAPFVPEPHVWEKLKWILGGAEGMRLVDWFDFLMHGTPWALLTYSLVRRFADKTG